TPPEGAALPPPGPGRVGLPVRILKNSPRPVRRRRRWGWRTGILRSMDMVDASSAAPKPKLLIVDDDHELCSMLAEYLGPEGFNTETVGSGPAALARLGHGP